MKFLLFLLFLAFIVGLRSADRRSPRSWPFVVLAFGVASMYLSYEMI